ncbi:threonine/homoserine/homoserine lactone efflux protein [Pedobacter sp. UYP24]
MKKQIALNVFYNLGLIVSVCGLFWAFKNNNYLIMALFVAASAFFLYLKIQLIKDVRSTLKSEEKSKGKEL